MPNENLKRLHENLSKKVEGFNVDYATFESDMQDDEKRARLHSNMPKYFDGFSVSFEDFSNDMGLKKKEPTPSPNSVQQPTTGVQEQFASVWGGSKKSTTPSGSEAPSTSSKVWEGAKGSLGKKPDVAEVTINRDLSPFDVGGRAEQTRFIYGDKALSTETTPAQVQFASNIYRSSAPTSDVAAGMKGFDYWIAADMATGGANYPTENIAIGATLRPSSTKNLPTQSKKVFDDYMSFLQKENPEEFKRISFINENVGKTLDKSETEFISYRTGAEEKIKGIGVNALETEFDPGKVYIRPMSNEQVMDLTNRAFQHQFRLLEAQYQKESQGGRINPVDENGVSLKEKYVLAGQALGKAYDQAMKENPEFGKIQEKARQQQLAEKKAQLQADLEYYETEPIKRTFVYGVYNPVKDVAAELLTSIYSLPKNLGVEDLGAFAAWADQNTKPDYAWKPTEMKKGLFEEGGFNFMNILGKTSGTVANMAALLGGGSVVGKVTGLGFKPGLVASSYTMSYNGYYDEAMAELEKKGITGAKAEKMADEHATGASLFTSLLELVAPNTSIVTGFKQAGAKEVFEKLATGKLTWGDAAKEWLKNTGKEIGEENLQELFQLVGDKMMNAATNSRTGVTELETKLTAPEVFETMFLTSLTTGVVSMKNARNANPLQKSAIYSAAADFDNFKNIIDQGVEAGTIDKSQAKEVISGVEEVKTIIESLPEDTKLNAQQQMDVANLVFQRKKIEEDAKKVSVITPELAKKKVAEIDNKLRKIDEQVVAVIRGKELKQVYEEDRKMAVEAAEASAQEAKSVEKEYSDEVIGLAAENTKEDFITKMIEAEDTGDMPKEFAKSWYGKMYDKIKSYDSKEGQPVSGEVGVGEELIETQPVEGASTEEVEGDRVLQTQEGQPRREVTPEVFSIFAQRDEARTKPGKEAAQEQLDELDIPEEQKKLAEDIHNNFEDITQQMLDNGEDLIIDCEL